MSTSPELVVIGVHPVPDADEPCHILEMRLRGFRGEFAIGAMTQPIEGQERSFWQVPYWEQQLNSEGTAVVGDLFFGPVQVPGDLRFVFYFHYLNKSRPIETQFGPVALPPETSVPERLSFLTYSSP